jgi:hypothetical protein
MQKVTKIAELKNINLQPTMFHLGKFSPICFSCWHSLCMLDFQQMVCVFWRFLCTTKLVSTNNIKSNKITQIRDAHKSKSSPFTMQESKPDDNHTCKHTQKKKQNNQSFYSIIFFAFAITFMFDVKWNCFVDAFLCGMDIGIYPHPNQVQNGCVPSSKNSIKTHTIRTWKDLYNFFVDG